MKLTATIEVEFEIEDGQPENAANASLMRGQGALCHAIERGNFRRTGVKQGSTKVQITSKTICP
jgi:hypothetical protein